MAAETEKSAENVMGALAGEIRRVAMIRERYLQAQVDFNRRPEHPSAYKVQIDMKPAIVLIDLALDRAVQAAGSGDALTCIASLQELRGFAGD